MNIKKYKNGNVDLRWDEEDVDYVKGRVNLTGLKCTVNDKLLEDFNDSDLYFNQINGYTYLVDFNSQRIFNVYNAIGYWWDNGDVVNALIGKVNHEKLVKLIPLGKREAKQLWIDLENGF